MICNNSVKICNLIPVHFAVYDKNVGSIQYYSIFKATSIKNEGTFNVRAPADTVCVPRTTPVEGFTQVAVPVFGTSIVMVMLLVGVV